MNFSIIFFNLPDVLDTVSLFFQKTLNQEAGIPADDSAKAAKSITSGLNRFSIWGD